MKSLKYYARRLARDLLRNMDDRRGFKTSSVDSSIMRKWMDEWTKKIEQVFKQARNPPVAWRVKDFADGWILCNTRQQAEKEAAGAGNLIEPLYAIPTKEESQ